MRGRKERVGERNGESFSPLTLGGGALCEPRKLRSYAAAALLLVCEACRRGLYIAADVCEEWAEACG